MKISKLLTKLALVTAGATLLSLATTGNAQAATIIDTTTSWNGIQKFGPFGENNGSGATYGQTFTVGTDNTLNSFTFFLDGSDNPDVIDFAGYVMAWDGTKATGSILYESAMNSTTLGQGFEQFTFNTGGVNLVSGQQYVAFLSASNYFDNQDGTGFMGVIQSNVYNDGNFVLSFNENRFSELSDQSWMDIQSYDVAFKATFSSGVQSVPEPTSMLGLLTVGGLGLGTLKRKQKA
jgi:hypothetical protein